MSGTVERTEVIQPEPSLALGALLDVPVPDLGSGESVPLMWHWLYLLDRPAQADLGVDGHPVRGTVPTPPRPGLRRMWAGGRVRTPGPLRCGEVATRRTRVLSTQEKTGRTGRLTFVAVAHEIRQRGEVVVEERQDLVYRESGPPTVEPGEATSRRPASLGEWSVETTPTLLFRFSALTYNGHRIHYDRDYARGVEGYPGLVTHGPLQALAMAEAARAHGVTGLGLVFDYRLVAPLFDHQGLVASVDRDGDRAVTAVRDVHGRRTAHGVLAPAGQRRAP